MTLKSLISCRKYRLCYTNACSNSRVNSFKISSICSLIASGIQSIFYWYSEHLANDLQSDQLVDNPSLEWISQKVSAHWTQISHSWKNTNAVVMSEASQNRPSRYYQSITLLAFFFLFYQLSSSSILYIVFCLFFVEELALTHFPWSTIYETQSLQYIPYPSPPATSTPDSLWSWICVWGNAMDKQPVQYRLKSFHLTVSLHRQMHRLTQSVVSKGLVMAFHGVCRYKINFPVWFIYIKHLCFM